MTVGGGTGSPVINRALLLGGVEHINAISAMYDNGGYTGRRRTRNPELDYQGQEVAYADAVRIMVSLIDPKQATNEKTAAINEILTGRTDDTGEVPGYIIAHRFFDKEKGFYRLQHLLEVLDIKLMGQVLPSSTNSAHIKFTTESGGVYVGENLLDEQAEKGSTDIVIDMVLEPHVPAFAPAREAMSKASVIFLSCGSIHGSMACNFLPEGMKNAIFENKKAQVYLITNLTSTSNENNEFSPRDYINLVEKYVGERRINGIVIPEISRRKFEEDHPEVALLYNQKEKSHFMGWEQEKLYEVQAEGVRVITHKAINIIDVPEQGKKIVRHSPEELAPVLASLLQEPQKVI